MPKISSLNRPPADLADMPGAALVLEQLQAAMRREHALIVQVIGHAYRLPDDDAMHAMEGLARQDMRHFKWLAETVVRLGGTPTVERAPVAISPASCAHWLAADVAAVDDLLGHYGVCYTGLPAVAEGAIAEVRSLIERIMADKRFHRETLAKIHRALAVAAEAGEAAEQPDHPRADDNPAAGEGEIQLDTETCGFLDFAIGHEYEVILQYLQHAFLLEDQWASRVLEDVAIEEMRHLGWLSEALIERGGNVVWEAKRLELHDDAVEMLELDLQREIEVEADYAQMIKAMQDPGIKRLFDRIGEHERYHAGTLGRLVARLKANTLAKAGPILGTALPARHAPDSLESLPTGDEPAVASPSAPGTASDRPAFGASPLRTGKCPFTVGGLVGLTQ